MFADDCCVYLSHSNLNHLCTLINADLCNVNEWIQSNKLTLNPNKSHFMLFSRKKPEINCEIKINEYPINKLDNMNFLGINLNCKLSWKNHIETVVNHLNKYRSILFLTRDNLSAFSLKLIYNSLIYPLLLYGNLIWNHCNKTSIEKLERAQKAIIRTIMKRSRYHHTNEDFCRLEILKIRDLFYFSSCCFVYKSLNHLTYPTNYFFINLDNVYNTRQTDLLFHPFCRTSQGQSSLSYYGCTDWNSLPRNIKSKPTFPSFKKSLRLHLLNKYND